MLLALGALFGALLLSGPPATRAADKKPNKNDAEEARLRQQIQKLQNELRERERRIDHLQDQLNRVRKGPDPDDARIRALQRRVDQLEDELRRERADDKKRVNDRELDALRRQAKELEALRGAGTVHTLVLRLKKGASQDNVNTLVRSAPKSLERIAGVRGVWVGRITATGGSAEADCHVGVVVLLDDRAALGRFLRDSGYDRFTDGLKRAWEPPAVYDFAP